MKQEPPWVSTVIALLGVELLALVVCGTVQR